MEVVSRNLGLLPDVEIVKEYVRETGNAFSDTKILEEVEKFAIWVAVSKMPISIQEGTTEYEMWKDVCQTVVSDAIVNGVNMADTIDNFQSKYELTALP